MREAARLPAAPHAPGRPHPWPSLGLAAGLPGSCLEALWMPLQESAGRLVPDARLIVAEQSGHFIPATNPTWSSPRSSRWCEAVRTRPVGHASSKSPAGGLIAPNTQFTCGARRFGQGGRSTLRRGRQFASLSGRIHVTSCGGPATPDARCIERILQHVPMVRRATTDA